MRTLYRATRVRSRIPSEPAAWVLVDGRHVERVGSGDPPRADRVVDLPGATILPGFVDTHVHLTTTGLSLADDAVERARSSFDLLRAIAERAAEGEEGPLYLWGYDESRWDDPTLPGPADLAGATGRPLVLQRADGHRCLVNAAAMAEAGIGAMEGVETDAAGEPTGVLTGPANDAASRWALASLSDHRIQDLQLRAAGLAASRGVTSVHEMAMPHWHGDGDLRVLLHQRARLPVDASPIVATMDLSIAIEHGLATVGGDLPVDGSIGARTAALTAPYEDGGTAAGGDAAGGDRFADDELAEFFHGGHVAGLQVGVHAIGDRAIEQVLRVWERVYRVLDSRERRHFRARRHRIEHAEMISHAQIERAAVLGLAVSVQPAFDLRWGGPGGLYERALGPVRSAAMNPVRTMVDRGVEVGVGSDAPVTALDPMACLLALEAHHEPAQRLARPEAIRLHTVGSARVGRQEEKKGALAPGMHADFAAYDDDPLTAPEIADLRPVLTVSLGREVFAT